MIVWIITMSMSWLYCNLEIEHWIALVTILLATIGWVITVRSNRMLSRRQHTINVLLEHSNDEYRRHAYTLYALYPGKEPITEDEAKNILESKNIKGSDFFFNFDDNTEPSNKSIYVSVCATLNYFEFLAIGIKNGDLDQAIMKDFFHSIICRYAEKTSNFILTRQQDCPEEYENLTDLYKEWESTDTFPNS